LRRYLSRRDGRTLNYVMEPAQLLGYMHNNNTNNHKNNIITLHNYMDDIYRFILATGTAAMTTDLRNADV